MSDQSPFPDPAPLPTPEPPSSPDAATTPADEPASPKAGWKTWVAAAAVGAAILIGGTIVTKGGGGGSEPVAASAAQDQTSTRGGAFPGGRGTRGEIESIDGSTLVVTATDQDQVTTSVTVKTTGDTTFTESVAGDVADLAVGDNIVVMGETADDTVAASNIIDSGDTATAFGGAAGGRPGGTDQGPPAGFQPPEGFQPPAGFQPPSGSGNGPGGPGGPGGGGFTAGEITAIDGTTITVKGQDDKTVTVTTTDDTTVTVTREIGLDDLAAGDTVTVTGTTDNDVVTATAVRRGDFAVGAFGGRPPTGAPTGATDS